MRIEFLSTKASAPPLVTDVRRMVRQHRDNSRHRRIIAAYRAAHPLCERCLSEGRTAATEEIHHIVEVAAGGRTQDDNLLALCIPCHNTIEQVAKQQQLEMKA